MLPQRSASVSTLASVPRPPLVEAPTDSSRALPTRPDPPPSASRAPTRPDPTLARAPIVSSVLPPHSRAPPHHSKAPTSQSRAPSSHSRALPPYVKAPPLDLRETLSASTTPPPPPRIPKRRRSPSPPPRPLRVRIEEGLAHDVDLNRLVKMPCVAEEREYVQILSGIRTTREIQKVGRFIVILKLFKTQKADRKCQYALGRAMLAIIGSEAREFVLRVLEEKIFEGTRLNALCRLKYFSVEITVLLDCLLSTPRKYDFLQVAIVNFQRSEILDLFEFVALHSPVEIVERMRRDDVFRGDFNVVDPDYWFSDDRKKDFIAFICGKLDIDVPAVCRMLFARVRLAGDFRSYEEGKTEISDFYKICTAYAKGDPAVMRLCTVLVAERFGPLGKFFCSMIKFPFSRDPLASSDFPSCVRSDALHGLACDRHSPLADISSVREFASKMSTARDVAIVYHQNTIEGKKSFDLIAFRFFN